jgi:hypothetical protein
MDLDAVKAELNQLLVQMQNQPEDRHELHQLIHDKLNELKALGLPLPDDLVDLEQVLADDLDDDSADDSAPPLPPETT